MHIDQELLKSNGAVLKHYKKNEIIFYEDEVPLCFYQIVSGSVKMYNSNNEDKQFVQGVFTAGSSFGEPPLFINEKYPSSAIAIEETTLLKMQKADFLDLFSRHHELQTHLIVLLSRRLYNKSITAKEIINKTAESRIVAFLDAYKKQSCIAEKDEIPYTRQMIADFTGLRVETVIRTLAKLKEIHVIDIIDRKIIY